ncbi:MAG: aminopeptidase P N-terminal domain-containing protein [bacterium]
MSIVHTNPEFVNSIDYSIFKCRRRVLLASLFEKYGKSQRGVIVVGAGFEGRRHLFRQESSFYYLTGLKEPATIACVFFDGPDSVQEVLYVPSFGGQRAQWVVLQVSPESNPVDFCFDQIKTLSDPILSGYSYPAPVIFKPELYTYFLQDITSFITEHTLVFTLLADNNLEQVQLFKSFDQQIPHLASAKRDISQVFYHQRRSKDTHELDCLRRAIQVTRVAHQAAAQQICAKKYENEIRATIEHVFTSNNMHCVFPSIVATGRNATILHYTECNQKLNDGDLVIIDIGAEFCGYAADLTRTYPVNGKFTERQAQIYNIVLAAQKHVQDCAKPGMFLRSDDEQERSLHHCAVRFFEQHGLAQYFPHGIGHFLGLDVHDVGDSKIPLAPGDVFTIEPGLYIPEENLGIRIEDDFLMTLDGAVCLSPELPKQAREIENFMKKS